LKEQIAKFALTMAHMGINYHEIRTTPCALNARWKHSNKRDARVSWIEGGRDVAALMVHSCGGSFNRNRGLNTGDSPGNAELVCHEKWAGLEFQDSRPAICPHSLCRLTSCQVTERMGANLSGDRATLWGEIRQAKE
jgi:hypothetical protein